MAEDRKPTEAEKAIAALIDAQRGLHAANIEILNAIEELATVGFVRSPSRRGTSEIVASRISKALEMNTDFTAGAGRMLAAVADGIEKGEAQW